MEQQKAVIPANYDPVALAEAGGTCFLTDPLGRPTKAWIKVKGFDSDTYQEGVREKVRMRSAAVAKRPKANKFLAPEEIEGDALDLLGLATMEWGDLGAVGYDANVTCTVGNAIELYRKRPDIKEQIDAYVAERSNFLPRAANA